LFALDLFWDVRLAPGLLAAKNDLLLLRIIDEASFIAADG
jgi:hypothetical protein